ncbi:hypothetical protein D3C81_1601140 [compost metagenome]
MTGRNERHGDLLADQVLRRIDPGTFAGHQGFSGADLGSDQKGFHRQFAGRGGGQGAGTEVADLHVARGHRSDHIGATVELAPVDAGLAGFFIVAVDLSDFRRIDGGLVGNGQVSRLSEPAGASQGQGGEQAQRSMQGHGELLVRRAVGR